MQMSSRSASPSTSLRHPSTPPTVTPPPTSALVKPTIKTVLTSNSHTEINVRDMSEWPVVQKGPALLPRQIGSTKKQEKETPMAVDVDELVGCSFVMLFFAHRLLGHQFL